MTEISGVPHGTASRYRNDHCRCEPCRAAQSASLRDWRARNPPRSRVVIRDTQPPSAVTASRNSDVTIRRPDGTTTSVPPYTPAELLRVLLGPQARIWQEMTARRHAEAAARREQEAGT